MNKILINTPDLRNQGGVAQYYKVFQLDKEPNIDYFNINNIGGNKLTRLTKTYRAFSREIAKYDLIVLNPSLNGKSFFRDAIFAYLAKKQNKKLMAFWMGWDDQYERKVHNSKTLKFVFDRTFGKVDCFVIFGEIFKTKLLALGIRSHVQFYRETMSISEKWINSFDIASKKVPINTDYLKIFFISRVVKAKGVYTCVDIAKTLKEKYPEKAITVHIAGDGEELENLKKYASDKKVDNIFFYGDIRGKQKFNLFLTSDLFLFPTQHGEGFPNVILEAMFFGMPLVTRPVAAIPDVVEHGKTGFIDAGTSAADFVPYIEAYMQLSHEQRVAMAEACHYNTVQKYNLKKVRERTVDFYNNF